MHKHVHSKATYLLRMHQFIAQQVGKGTNFHSSHKILSSICKHVHSKATYLLRVHQFTAQQVGKGGKEGTNFHSSHKIQYWVCTNMFIQRQFTSLECTSSQDSKWEKEVKNEQISTHHTNPISSMQTCSFKGNIPPNSAPFHSTASG